MDVKQQSPPQSLPDTPDLPPGTYEFIDTKKKKNWKKITEIIVILLIASVPAIMTLFRIEYPTERVYEIVNPAFIGTFPGNSSWKSVINKTKEVIQSATRTTNINENSNNNSEDAEKILNTPTPTVKPSPTIQPAQSSTQSTSTPTTIQEQNTAPSPYPTEEVIEYPTSTPTSVPEPTQDNSQQGWEKAFYACIGKTLNQHCSYYSSQGNKIQGRCQMSTNGYLVCVDDD